jgi:hypothetical protein
MSMPFGGPVSAQVPGRSILDVPGVDVLIEWGGDTVREWIHRLSHMEGNRARLYDAATGWANAGGHATLATDSFKDDLAVIKHWEAGAAETFKANVNEAVAKLALLGPAYTDLGKAVAAAADALASVNETVILATLAAIGAILAAVAAAVPTLCASTAAIPAVIGGLLTFFAGCVALLVKFAGDLVTMLNKIEVVGHQMKSVDSATPASFEGVTIDVPDPSTWKAAPTP